MVKLSTHSKIRIARLLHRLVMLARRLTGAGETADVRRGGIRWQLNLREGIDLSIFLLGRFERGTVRAYRALLKPGDTVLDVGANIGAHTLPFARCVAPHGRVVAFEPTDYAFGKLQTNIKLNPALAALITAEQLMLAASAETALPSAIYSSWPVVENGADVHPTHRGMAMTTTGARIDTLDRYVQQHGFARVDLIKLDVDGHECTVLRGALETLKQFRPAILMEIMPYGLVEQGASLDELLTILRPLGYGLFDLHGRLLPADASLATHVPPGGGINVICRV